MTLLMRRVVWAPARRREQASIAIEKIYGRALVFGVTAIHSFMGGRNEAFLGISHPRRRFNGAHFADR